MMGKPKRAGSETETRDQAFDSAILNRQPPRECCVSRVILEFRGVIVAPGENRRIEGLAPILLLSGR